MSREPLTLVEHRSVPAPGARLCGLAWDGEHLWHSDAGTERIYCLEPETGAVVRDLACPGVRTCLSYDGGRLWQVAGRPKALRCVDPVDGSVLRVLPLDSEHACGVEVRGPVFWLTIEGEGRVELRSLADGRLLRALSAERRIAGVTVAEGLLWYAVDADSLLVALDLESGAERARHEVEGTPTGLTWDGEHLWYADFAGRRLVALAAS